MTEQCEAMKEKLLAIIADLPESRLQEVLDFASFIRSRDLGPDNPILNASGCLSGTPISVAEIEEELYGEGPA